MSVRTSSIQLARICRAPAVRAAFSATLLAGLAACGGADSDSGASPGPPPASPNPAPNPTPSSFTVGGTISGLTGSVSLQNNGGDTLAVSVNGPFTFATSLANSATYSVTVSAQPNGQTCAVGGGSGTVSGAAVTGIAVTCTDNPPPPPAAPAIVRQPRNVTTHENGSVLFFVEATGESLNYEWRLLQSGTVVKSGPEPFLLRVGQNQATDDGDCYRVTISNAGGSVESEQACKTILPINYDFNADDGVVEADGDLATVYGEAMMRIIESTIGALTGPVSVAEASLFGPLLMPAGPCSHSGTSLGAMIDGVPVTSATNPPLGQHSISFAWDHCRGSPDDLDEFDGALRVVYDFPTQLGVGSYTLYSGGLWFMNGLVTVTVERTIDSNGRNVDDIRIEPQEDFTLAQLVLFRQSSISEDRIEVRRRSELNSGFLVADRSDVDFRHLTMRFYDVEGSVGSAQVADGSDPAHPSDELTFNSDGTASGELSVDMFHAIDPVNAEEHFMGTLVPDGDGTNWALELVIPTDPG